MKKTVKNKKKASPPVRRDIVAWGDNDLFDACSGKLFSKIKKVLDNHPKRAGTVKPSQYVPQKNDVLVVFSLGSYGSIAEQAVALGFAPKNIKHVSEFDPSLPQVRYLRSVPEIAGSPLVCGRISGNVNIRNGLLIVSDQHKALVDVFSKATLNVDNFTLYENVEIKVRAQGVLTLGSNSCLHKGSTVRCTDKTTIGNDCVISWNVSILDHDGDYEIVPASGNKKTEVKIEDHVWIGHNSSILKGVTIGKGSIIAAHSLVNKDVPPGCLYGGVPAKLIRENVEWK